jgi:hypothetical protein
MHRTRYFGSPIQVVANWALLVLRWSMKVLDFVAFLDFAPRYAMTAMELICPALYNVSSMGTLRKKL